MAEQAAAPAFEVGWIESRRDRVASYVALTLGIAALVVTFLML